MENVEESERHHCCGGNALLRDDEHENEKFQKTKFVSVGGLEELVLLAIVTAAY